MEKEFKRKKWVGCEILSASWGEEQDVDFFIKEVRSKIRRLKKEGCTDFTIGLEARGSYAEDGDDIALHFIRHESDEQYNQRKIKHEQRKQAKILSLTHSH